MLPAWPCRSRLSARTTNRPDRDTAIISGRRVSLERAQGSKGKEANYVYFTKRGVAIYQIYAYEARGATQPCGFASSNDHDGAPVAHFVVLSRQVSLRSQDLLRSPLVLRSVLSLWWLFLPGRTEASHLMTNYRTTRPGADSITVSYPNIGPPPGSCFSICVFISHPIITEFHRHHLVSITYSIHFFE